MLLSRHPAFERIWLYPTDLLLPASIGLWALGVSRTNVTAIGPYGLPPELPLVFYAGVALLIVSAAIELARDRLSGLRMSMHVAALVVMLYGTAPMVYSQGRYSWLYKTMGVVQYVNAHGSLNRHIDIYQNWPGFFALAAWFGKVAGVASPLAYAKWAQLVFELAALPLLYVIYHALSMPVRLRWTALLLYFASNWIGQDYLSPQALGTLLSLGIMAMALRWLYVGGSANPRRPGHAWRLGSPSSLRRPSDAGPPALLSGSVVVVYFVLTFTHELSPYILALQLSALAVARLLRPRWIPIALGAVAIGYLLPRFAFVNSHFGLLNSIGAFFSNAAPPAFKHATVPRSQRLIEYCAEGLSLGMWSLAVVGVWLRRRSSPIVFTLALLAFSPIILLGVAAYGNEGILRAYLFSLPWTAALAALALVPVETSASIHRSLREPSRSKGPLIRARMVRVSVVRIPLALTIALALFFPAFFGDDRSNTISQAEVTTITSFLLTARAGPIYCAVDHASFADTSRYNIFPLIPIFGNTGLLGRAPITSDIANIIARAALVRTGAHEPAYVVVAPSMLAYNQAYKVTQSDSFTVLLAALAKSRTWRLVIDRSGTVIYEIRPRLRGRPSPPALLHQRPRPRDPRRHGRVHRAHRNGHTERFNTRTKMIKRPIYGPRRLSLPQPPESAQLISRSVTT